MSNTKLYYPYNGKLSYKNGIYLTYAGVVYLTVEDASPGQNPVNFPLKFQRAFSSGGATTFLQLTDTPSTYAASAYSFPMVNSAETGLVFGNVFGATNYATVDAATTGNITLSGNQTIDGIVNPATVLVWQQTIATQNGVYTTSSGAWSRAANSDTSAELNDQVVFVESGTTYKGRYFDQLTDTPTIGVDNIVYTPNRTGGAASKRLSGITAGVKVNTINSTSFKQEWQWNTLAGTDAFKLSSTSTAAASNAQVLFNVALSGANASGSQTTYATQVSNTHTGSGTNIAGYFTASGGTANYGIIVAAGSVGIGTTAPARLLDLKGAQPWIRLTEAGGQYFEIQGASGGSTYIVTSVGPIYFYPDSIQTFSLLSTGITLHKNTLCAANFLVQAAGAYFEVYNTTASGTGDWYVSCFTSIKKWMLLRYDGTNSMFSFIPNSAVTAGAVLGLTDGGLLRVGDNATPTAYVDIKAGTTAIAPLKFTAGTLLTTPVLGTLEYADNGTTGHLYVTVNILGVATRVQIV